MHPVLAPLIAQRRRAVGRHHKGRRLAHIHRLIRRLGRDAGRHRCRGHRQQRLPAGRRAVGRVVHHAVKKSPVIGQNRGRRGVARAGGAGDIHPVLAPLIAQRRRAVGGHHKGRRLRPRPPSDRPAGS